MLALLDLRGLDPRDAPALRRALAPAPADEGPVEVVRSIIARVRAGGDRALLALTAELDGCRIDELRVPASALTAALDDAPTAFRDALTVAADRIRTYHEAQLAGPPVAVDVDGVSLREVTLPVDRAGLYVPGGRAAYPSTVLMTAIPARLAGVAEIALCVPPGPDGAVAAPTLAAAALTGVDEVYRVGGAQAIAALAYGTESIAPVDVIAGPGNVYVALAKREVTGVVGIDALAGPSEVVVVADGTAPPEFAAADLLAQVEHGPGGTALLVAWSAGVVEATNDALTRLVADHRRRAAIEAALETGGRAVLVDDALMAMNVVNQVAPEHLELLTDDPEMLVPFVRNAGAVFCGPWAPAALGDYAAGVNHVLPTARTARYASALRIDTFRKHVHVVRATAGGLAALAPTVEALATAEGLEAHAASVALRTASLTPTDAS